MSAGGFSNPIIGGDGTLVYPAIKSPNYSPADNTGWAINKDGTATFYSVSLPGTATGAKVTFSSTAPASPNVGDLWYDTANGLQLSQWTGTAWTPYQFGTAAIQGGAVTPGLIAAGDTLNPNPYFSGGDISGWGPLTGSAVAAVPTGPVSAAPFGYPWCAEITCIPGAAYPGITGQQYPVNPGDPVQVNSWFNCAVTGFLSISYYDSAGIYITNSYVTIPDTGGDWVYSSVVGNVPAGAANAALNVGVYSGATTGSEVIYVTGMTVLGKVNGALIEANTITADQIEAGTITAAQIAAGTITAAEISAGTVIAGAVDGTTITGAVFEGTNWLENGNGMFLYAGTPAFGNLVASICPVQVTDAFGNTAYAGLSIYGSSGGAIGMNPGGSGTNVSIIMIPGVTPSFISGCAVLFANSSGELIVIDGTDGATYATQRRSLVLGSNSGSLTSLSNVFQSGVGVRTYRIHAQLYINATSGAQFTCAFALPGGTGTGELGYMIARAATFVGAVAGAANASVGVAVSLGTASGYVVQLNGTFTPSGAGTFSFQVGSLTGTGLIVAAGSFIDIMPV